MERGFTLVEIAIVVLVLGLLLGSLLGPLSVRVEQQEIQKTSDQMEEIKEALYGYAMANGALPCPDGDGDGMADPLVATTTSPCNDFEGGLPFETIGATRGDAWGFRFLYRVTLAFTVADNRICAANDGDLDLCDNPQNLELDDPNIRVGTRPLTSPHALASDPASRVATAPAVVLSHGKNGFGATRVTGGSAPPPEPNTDELTNANRNRATFVSRHYSFTQTPCDDTDPGAAYCGFDDIVIWLSANVLKYRLVQAGRLP